MPESGTGVLTEGALDRERCLVLLGSVPIGRFVHTARALPAIWPVPFLLLPDGIYLRTVHGSGVWRGAEANAVVAFEADDADAEGHCGWSVVVTGRAAVVQGDAALRRPQRLLPEPCSSNAREAIVRVSLELVDGSRIAQATALPPLGATA